MRGVLKTARGSYGLFISPAISTDQASHLCPIWTVRGNFVKVVCFDLHPQASQYCPNCTEMGRLAGDIKPYTPVHTFPVLQGNRGTHLPYQILTSTGFPVLSKLDRVGIRQAGDIKGPQLPLLQCNGSPSEDRSHWGGLKIQDLSGVQNISLRCPLKSSRTFHVHSMREYNALVHMLLMCIMLS